ncbi:head-tail adaptor protein [Aestuariibius sp. 2305UL40-4]|uniref:head-tail adaptor protein n=1 Tax=Aestuariibius violaceus TaxID=3234132 RepID=UPI00345EA12B
MSPHLNRALVLEAPVETPDGAGGFIGGWEVLGTLWAELAPGRGRRAAGVEVAVSKVPYRITVRGAPSGARSRPVAGQRFRDGSRVFHVLAVSERDPGGRYLVCTAEEVTA